MDLGEYGVVEWEDRDSHGVLSDMLVMHTGAARQEGCHKGLGRLRNDVRVEILETRE